ncbi:glutamate--tRNA ligase [Candidatus Pacearchaeota archaeon CG10_big_fil_rev_8_21_14_0_10_30_48]|nr:MAG: glutamate--tRNA ligase [Candidatus Pacearchaeota archaeon CG10_big_fil_rev_8_21_14_0_10_30_48]
MVKDFSNEIMAYALANALEHGSAKSGVILPKLFKHGLKKEQIKDFISVIEEIVKLVNAMPKAEMEKKFGDFEKYLAEKEVHEDKGLPELKKISKKMVFRLAPFPSGALHIGNMKTYLLNALYAEKYKGKIILVIDDTIGSKEKAIVLEAYSLIPEAFDFLKVKYGKPIIYKSDRLEIYYKYAEKIIEKGKAYVCTCPQELMRENRAKGISCACRMLKTKEQLARWKKMFSMKEGEGVLRLKTDIKHKNPAFRDRVLFRISDREHVRVKDKYRVWPLLEFSWAIDDYLLKITHAIRGKELMMEGEMQKYIWDIFGWRGPEFIYTGLIKLEGIGGKLSKSKSQEEVYSGKFEGWEDPRTWSVQSLAKRGILAESLREFVEKIGLNQKEIVVPIDDLYAINRRKIDAIANRYSFVENPVKIILDKKLPKEIKVKIHPEKKSLKTISLGDELFVTKKDFEDFKKKPVRLMHLFNVQLDKNAKFISEDNDPKIRKINWVSKGHKIKVLMPTGIWINGLAEEATNKLKDGEIVQFERFGFCKYHGKNRFNGEQEFWYTHD